jgi:methionine-rich copper-binding protein CopC
MPRLRYLGLGAAGVVVALAAWLLSMPAAPALGSSNPSDGATLARAPDAVELAFTTAPDLSVSHVWVRDGAGQSVNTGDLRLDGADRLRQPVDRLATGTLTVTYHVTFTTGAELIGALHFGVGVTPSAPAVAAPAHDHGVDPISAVLLALDGVIAVTVVVLLLVRRPRARRQLEPLRPRR